MQWNDEGIVLGAKPWAENNQLVTLFTKNNGLYKGIVKKTKRLTNFQQGTIVDAIWKARLSDHLGMYSLEIIDMPFSRLISYPQKILFLKTITSLLELILPERHPYPVVYDALNHFLSHLHLPKNDVFYDYSCLEFFLIKELGFGFDFSECSLCGKDLPIHYISPRTGRGACKDCGKPYAEKLFAFDVNAFLDPSSFDRNDKKYKEALTLTGYFLSHHIIKQIKPSGELPLARAHLIESLHKIAA